MSMGRHSLPRNALIVMAVLGGAVSAADAPPAAAAKPAQLVVIRGDAHMGGWVSARILVDGEEVGKVGNSRCARLPLEPGTRRITMRFGSDTEISVTAEPGGEVFLYYEIKSNGSSVDHVVREYPRESVVDTVAACRWMIPPKRKKKAAASTW
jgi:hypothetical protein